MSDISAAFGKPFAQQVAAFRIRLAELKATASWKDVWLDGHDQAFMVAGATKAELLADFAAAIDKAITRGTSFDEFKKDFQKAVADHNWHGWTGEETEKGRAWRMRVIYKTNLAVSQAAGRYAQLKAGGFKYWIYKHGASREPRVQHLAWDGLVLPADHEFWKTHFPPNGWGCSCHVVGANSMESALRRGGRADVSSCQDNWRQIDPRTGAPPGIDKGWNYAPGATVSETINALATKPVNWDYSLATAYMRDIPERNRDLFSEAFRRQPALAEALAKDAAAVLTAPGADMAQQVRTLGLITSETAARVEAAADVELGSDLYDFAIDRAAIRHVFDSHDNPKIELSRGQIAVEASDFALLPQVVADPDSIEPAEPIAGRGPVFILKKRFGDRRILAIFEIRPRRRRIALVTMWIEKLVGASSTLTP